MAEPKPSRFEVRSFPKLRGQTYFWRAGRAWPKEGVVIEVVDAIADPEPLHPHRVGRRTLARLQAERTMLSVLPVPDDRPISEPLTRPGTPKEAEAEAKIRKVESENLDLRERLRALEDFAHKYLIQQERAAVEGTAAAPDAPKVPPPPKAKR